MSPDPSRPAAPDGRTAKGDKRRAALLSALERLLADRPLGRVGIGDLTAEAQVTRSVFYFYFPSKGAAVAELLWSVFDEMARGADTFFRPSTSPQGYDARAAVRASLGSTLELWKDHRVLLLAMLDARGTDEDVQELWESWLEAFAMRIAGAIDAQRDADLAPAGAPALFLARVLLAANERTLERLVRRAPTDDGEERSAMDALEHVWMAAIYGVAP